MSNTTTESTAQDMRPPSTALALARDAGADIAARDRWIALAASGGDSPAVIAKFLGLSRQQVYAVLEERRQLADSDTDEFTVEMSRAWQATESALEQLTGGEAFERLVQRLLYDLDPGVRPLGGTGDRARDAAADLSSGDGSVYSISLEAQWTRKIRREVGRILEFGYTPAFVYAITNRPTTRRAEDGLEEWAAERGVRLRVLSRRWLVTKLLHPDHLDLRQEALGLAPPAPKVFLTPGEYRRLLDGRPAHAGLHIERVGNDDEVEQFLSHVHSRPATVLSGAGGIGKTRLALDAADLSPDGEAWRFLDEAVEVPATALGELSGTQELVVVIDNAHRRQDLPAILGLLERRHPRPRVVLVVRPHRVESIQAAASSVWIGSLVDDDYFRVPRLDDFAIASLVKSPPFEVKFDGMVRAIVSLAEGNPQVAVLAASLARDGALIPELSRAQVFERHVAGLLASLTDRSPEARQLRELLAIVTAIGSIDRDDHTAIAAAARLVGPGPQAIRRWLSELADLGLLIDREGTYAVKPDLLSEHVFASSFFPANWQPILSYRDVVEAFADSHLLSLCSTLGKAPAMQLDVGDPGLVALHHAVRPILSGQNLAPAAQYLRELLPGAESVVIGDFERIIDRVESDPDQLSEAAGLRLIEATQRVTERFATAWNFLLRLMAAATSSEVSDAARKAMHDIFLRVPVDTSEQDGWVLENVQTALAEATKTYAREARTHGQLSAAAAAGHALLAVMFETSGMSVDQRNQLVLRAYALPATEATKRALGTGIDVVTSTFVGRDVPDQLRSIEAATALARQAAGFPGPFGLQISAETRAAVERTVQQWDSFVTAHSDQFPLPTRAAVLEYFVDRREFISRAAERANETETETKESHQTPEAPSLSHIDDELDEFILLVYPRAINKWGRHTNWADEEQAQQTRCAVVARRLVSQKDWLVPIRKWENWLEETRGLYERQSLGLNFNRVLFEAARLKSSQTIELVGELIATNSPLRVNTGHAINHLVSEGLAGQACLDKWIQGDEPTRQTIASAIASIDRPEAIAATNRLANDESRAVKLSALHGLRYGDYLTESRVALGLRIAGELADIDALSTILMIAEAGGVTLTAQLADQAKAALLSTATRDRIDEHHLVRVINRLREPLGDLSVAWTWEHINWLEQANQLDWMLDVLPATLGPHVREHATEADLDQALDRFETADTSTIAIDALTKLLNWIDPASPKITNAIIRLDATPDSGPRLHRLLGLKLSWDDCRIRAEALAEPLDPSLVLLYLVEQMLPDSWTPGTLYTYIEDALGRLTAWANSSAPGSFRTGIRTAIQTLERRLERELVLDAP